MVAYIFTQPPHHKKASYGPVKLYIFLISFRNGLCGPTCNIVSTL